MPTDNRLASEILRWDEISSVWHERISYRRPGTVRRHRFIKYAFMRNDNTRIDLSSRVLAGVAGFGKVLEERVSAHLQQKVLKGFERGEVIPFGPVAVSLNTIDNGRERLLWSEVESIDNLGSAIVIRKKDQASKWMRLQTRDIPNLPVFPTVVSQFTDVQ